MATGNSLPVNISQTLLWKTRNFPEEVYDFNPSDNITTLMQILLGGAGTGQLTNVQVAARLTQQYLQFSDLDNTLGELLNSPRLPNEIYSSNVNPFTDQLNYSQWQDVFAKDAAYRERLTGLVTALMRGGNPLGIKSTAEAVYQTPVQVVENWTTASGVMVSKGYSRGFGANETIVIPNVPSGVLLPSGIQAGVLKSVENIKPLGSMLTIVSGINNFVPVNYTSISGNSEFFFLHRTVTANNINIPSYAANSSNATVLTRYWLNNGVSTIAPTFAFSQPEESEVDLTNNISTVNITAFTASGQSLNSTSNTLPLGTPKLNITSTFFGAQ